MAQQYYGLLTNIGLAKLAAAASGSPALALASMAFGDGNGVETAPAKTATALVNERYRAPLVDKYPHPTNPSIIYVEGIIPSGIGGWTLREAGIYDAAGDLIVIAKPPAMNVALIAEGASTEGIVRLPIVFDNLDAVTLMVDPTVTLATQGWVLDRLLSRPFLTVNSVSTVATPANPAPHSLYVVPAGATGAWAAQVGKLAYYLGGWIYRDAPVSLVVGASDTGKYWRRTAGGWAEFVASGTEPGLVQFATAAEVLAATVEGKAVAPKTLAPAVQSGAWSYAVAGGTANALTISLDPAPEYIREGMPFRIKISYSNTGPATLTVNGGGSTGWLRNSSGGDLIAGDLSAGSVVEVVWDGSVFRLMGHARGRLLNVRVFTSSTAYNPTPGTGYVEVEVYGAGGGGAGVIATGTAETASGGGGGSGAYAYKLIRSGFAGVYISVGIAGVGGNGAIGFNTGGPGGASSFGAHVSAPGGGGGVSAGPTSTTDHYYAAGGTGGSVNWPPFEPDTQA